MENESKRKAIILTFIGALTLLFVVVGGTFAYFQIVNTDEGSTSTDFNAQTDALNKYGTPLLTKKSDLYIELSASDMAYSKANTKYYATLKTEPQEKNYEEEKQNHVISTASIERPEGDNVVEDAYLKCTSELTITIDGTMKEALQTGDGTLYLGTKSNDGNKGSVTPTSFDLAELVNKQEEGLNKATVNYRIKGYTSIDVTADIEIVNSEAIQNVLAGTNIQITITNNNLSCSVSEKPTEAILREKDKGNYLSKSLVGGMYRYQGLATDDINNYICLGDNCCTTKSCPASSDDDMYRIIGITQSGEMKVIKKTSLTAGVKWWNIYINIKWPQSLIYQKLNGKSEDGTTNPNLDDPDSYYYSLDDNLKNLIVKDHSWLYGDTTSSGNYNGDTMYEIESGSSEATYYKKTDLGSEIVTERWNDRIEAPLGLMYISDYYYAYKTNEEDAGKPGYAPNAKKSWIHLSNNESLAGFEWTMSRYGFVSQFGSYQAWYVDRDAYVVRNTLDYTYALCPVFYLLSTIELTGEGSLTNPFQVKQLTME